MAANSPRLDALIARLRDYCEAGRGRKTALIQFLGIQPHQLTSWLSGDKRPGGEYTLAIQEWLAAQGAA